MIFGRNNGYKCKINFNDTTSDNVQANSKVQKKLSVFKKHFEGEYIIHIARKRYL